MESISKTDFTRGNISVYNGSTNTNVTEISLREKLLLRFEMEINLILTYVIQYTSKIAYDY